jgi:hypothetical protein
LVTIADSDPLVQHAGAAVWALGKLGDESLRPLFTRFLRRAVGSMVWGSHNTWQAILALSEMEPSLRGSGGVLDFERNFSLAKEYLRAHPSD